MRVLVWHGWLLDGTGSNVYTAKVAERWRLAGHDVVVLCQERSADRFDFVDAIGTVDAGGISELRPTGAAPSSGRVVMLRPEIGALLPVFVFDEYEGFDPKRFVDLSDEELTVYLERNVGAMRAAAAWHEPDAVVAGHAIPGPVIARRAVGAGRYVSKVHGSDLEYAIHLQARYRDLAREGLGGSRAVTGASRDVLARAVAVAPAVRDRIHVVPPGVDVERWRPRSRAEALTEAAGLLARDDQRVRGRPGAVEDAVRAAAIERDGEGLERLARTYDQRAPDPDAPERLRDLAGHGAPIVGYLGKLIPEKGVERLIEALALQPSDVRALVVGFGLFREWLAALVQALDSGDAALVRWVADSSPIVLDLEPDEIRRARGLAARVAFTGRLDHRYAPLAVAAMDVLVVPSTLGEAFGMVAAEAAAAGVLPLVARHSALAEVAAALEGSIGAPGLLSFDPGEGATRRLAEALRRIVELPTERRSALGEAARSHVVAEWTWERTAERLLSVAL